MYAKGQGVPQDDWVAAAWRRKVAEHGNVAAQFNLGVMYEDGQCVPQDYARAAASYRTATEQGNAAAARPADFVHFPDVELVVAKAQALLAKAMIKPDIRQQL